jgi:hypothetical protein
MLRAGGFITLNMTAYAFFAVLAGLVLLAGADHVSPGCTGPAVERCDYIAVAKAANSGPNDRHFRSELGFNVFDRGSAVWVQQSYPDVSLIHASGVLIDKKSCRPCQVVFYGHRRPPMDGLDAPRGRLIQSIAPENPVEAAKLRRTLVDLGIPPELDHGTPAERR